jgi:hypothetical protein
MVTLIANPLRNWHFPAIRKRALGGKRSASELEYTELDDEGQQQI